MSGLCVVSGFYVIPISPNIWVMQDVSIMQDKISKAARLISFFFIVFPRDINANIINFRLVGEKQLLNENTASSDLPKIRYFLG